MRDETIQTAQASVAQSDSNAQRIGVPGDEAAVWHRDTSQQSVLFGFNNNIGGKTATSPKPLPSRFNTQPEVNAPSPTEMSTVP